MNVEFWDTFYHMIKIKLLLDHRQNATLKESSICTDLLLPSQAYLEKNKMV